MRSRSPYSAEISSTSGAIMRQGPHQGAQKSTWRDEGGAGQAGFVSQGCTGPRNVKSAGAAARCTAVRAVPLARSVPAAALQRQQLSVLLGARREAAGVMLGLPRPRAARCRGPIGKLII